MKTKFWDWVWWKIGFELWKKSASNHLSDEVNRRLGWMRLDCLENSDSKEGIEWKRKNPISEERK